VLALTDSQLELLQDALAALDNEADRKRLLELVGDACRVRDIDLQDAISHSLEEIRASKKRKKFGDLMLPENFQVVTAKNFGKIFGIVGPPYRPKQK
jgi:hypothetical protein